MKASTHFKAPAEITTERLVLRRLWEDDAMDLFPTVGDPVVMEHWHPGPDDDQPAAARRIGTPVRQPGFPALRIDGPTVAFRDTPDLYPHSPHILATRTANVPFDQVCLISENPALFSRRMFVSGHRLMS